MESSCQSFPRSARDRTRASVPYHLTLYRIFCCNFSICVGSMNAATMLGTAERKNAWVSKVLWPMCGGLNDPRYNKIRLTTPLCKEGNESDGRKIDVGNPLYSQRIAPFMCGSSGTMFGGEVLRSGYEDEELGSVSSPWWWLCRMHLDIWPVLHETYSTLRWKARDSRGRQEIHERGHVLKSPEDACRATSKLVAMSLITTCGPEIPFQKECVHSRRTSILVPQILLWPEGLRPLICSFLGSLSRSTAARSRITRRQRLLGCAQRCRNLEE